MTAPAIALLGLEFVKVEELHYGKLVASEGGHVAMGEGYTTTYRTSGLLHPDRLLPTRLLDGALLLPDHIEEAFRDRGFLFCRLVDESLVAMRARYRPEGGEGRPGRTYLQASIFQIDARDGFRSVPPKLIPWISKKEVIPDVITRPVAKRIDVEPEPYVTTLPSAHDVTAVDLDAKGPKQRVRIAAAIHAMRHAASIVMGDDSFDDPKRRLDDFVGDVDFALTVMVQAGQTVSRNFRIACGLSPHVAGCTLALSSVAPSTRQSDVTWDDVVRMIDPVAYGPLGAVGARRNTKRWVSQPSRGTSGQGLSVGPPSAPRHTLETYSPATAHPNPVRNGEITSEELTSVVPTPANLPGDAQDAHDYLDGNGDAQVVQIRPMSPVAAGRQTAAEALNLFSRIFEHARTTQSSEASSKLFGFAADHGTHKTLKNWHPFDKSSPTLADILLGLLMGLWARGDLLDRYTLTEFFYILPHLQILDPSGRPNWDQRLIKCADHRIGELGSLTRDELELVEEYGPRFSSGTKDILVAEGIICGYRSSSGNIRHMGLGEKDPLEDASNALKRMQTRCEKANAESPERLVFCTSAADSDATSVFFLRSRHIVSQKSSDLLRQALSALHDLVEQLGGTPIQRPADTD
jgi:hypothetical protein